MVCKKKLMQMIGHGLKVWDVAQECNVTTTTIRNWMKKYEIDTPRGFFSRGRKMGRPPGTPMSEKQKRELSERFSGEGNPFYGEKHTATTKRKMSQNHADFSGDNNPFRRSIEADPDKREEHKERCRKLWEKRDDEYRRAFAQRLRKGYEGISGTFWSRVRKNAKTRGYSLIVTEKEAWSLFERQGARCAISGVPLWFEDTLHGTTASLDRIDNDKGYTTDNIQWVHKHINIMRNTLSVDEFVQWCRRVAEWNAH